MPCSEKLSFSDLVNLLLVQLYELDQEHPGEFFDLNDINRRLKSPCEDTWLLDAGNVLASRGLIQEAFTFGALDAQITGEGRLLVEQRRSQPGTVEKQYYDDPQGFVVTVTGNQNVVAVASGGSDVRQRAVRASRAPAFRLLDQIKKAVEQDQEIGSQQRQDLLEDVTLIEKQLERQEPNRPALAALLQPLSQVASIAGHVANLIRLINL